MRGREAARRRHPPQSPSLLRATEALSLGVALQDVQDALGHADPRTTRLYDRNRNRLDRSPVYLLAGALTGDGALPSPTSRSGSW